MFFSKNLKKKMESWHLEDLIRTVETPERSTRKRVGYAKSIIQERRLEETEIKSIAEAIFLNKVNAQLETRSVFYQSNEMPYSFYLTEEKRIQLYKQAIDTYQSKMDLMSDGLDGYIG